MPRHEERSAGFVIFIRNNGADFSLSERIEYLLLDYGRHWDFAKGHVKKKESDLDAATRELQEETGIAKIEIIPDFRHVIDYHFRDRRKGVIHKTVVFFLARADAREVTLSHEHVGFEFLPYEQAIERVTYPTARELLTAAHQHLTVAK